MKTIYYIGGALNEVEFDISKAFASIQDMQIKFFDFAPGSDTSGITREEMTQYNPYYNFMGGMNAEQYKQKIAELISNRPDLIIDRSGWLPYHLGSSDYVAKICKKNGIPFCIWTTEQGEMRETQLKYVKYTDWIVVNNKNDVKYYKEKFPEKRISYMPFGCTPNFHKKMDVPKIYDCITDGLHLHSERKLHCVDIMVRPLIRRCNIAIFGEEPWLSYLKIPKEAFKWRYQYLNLPTVYGNTKIYIGITANYDISGYGSKLARVLGCGAFTLWHKTRHMEEDGLKPNVHLCVTENAEETIINVFYYLNNEKEREKIAINGMKFAHENWNYEKLFRQLLSDGGI